MQYWRMGYKHVDTNIHFLVTNCDVLRRYDQRVTDGQTDRRTYIKLIALCSAYAP